MRDDDHRHASLGQPADHGKHLRDELRIESGGGLVEQHEPGRDRQRARDRHALLLPSRQAVRHVMSMMRQPNGGQEFHAARLHEFQGLAVDLDRRLTDILEGREVLEQIELLKHHADAGPGSLPRDVTRRSEHAVDPRVADMSPVHGDLTAIERLEVIDEAQQRALPRAARTHDRHDFAAIHGEVQAAEHVAVAIRLPDVGADHERQTRVSGLPSRLDAGDLHNVDRDPRRALRAGKGRLGGRGHHDRGVGPLPGRQGPRTEPKGEEPTERGLGRAWALVLETEPALEQVLHSSDDRGDREVHETRGSKDGKEAEVLRHDLLAAEGELIHGDD